MKTQNVKLEDQAWNIMVLLFILFSIHTVLGAQTVTGTGKAFITENITPCQAHIQALQDAKVNALRAAGVPENVVSMQEQSTFQNTQYNVEKTFLDKTASSIYGSLQQYDIIADTTYIDAQQRIVRQVTISANVVKDSSRHCEARSNLEPSDNSLPSYHAGRVYGDCENGTGTCNYYNGDTYTGTWKDGKRNGYGTYRWADGRTYNGTWTDGLQSNSCHCEARSNLAASIAIAKHQAISKLDNDAINFSKEDEAEKQKLQ